MTRRAMPLLALICAASLAAGAETGGAGAAGSEAGGAGAGRNGRLAGLPLTEALEVVRTLGLRLVYSSEIVRPWMRVEREPEPGEPGAVLDDLLAPHGLEAREGPGGLLVIVRAPGDGRAPGGIEGVVRSGADRRPVVAARVMVAGTPFEAAAGPDGGFLIPRLPADTYDLVVTVPGLREERFEGVAVRPGQTTRVRLVLAAVATIREAIVVTPDRRPSSAERSDAGCLLEGDELRAVPGVGDDLHRALARQPGLAAADLSAAFSIRGG
ncbi:MAG: carboxypeptidase-like regulatory domain-containing protein, partial [Candidatus Polarisedimenticolia bacterium]